MTGYPPGGMNMQPFFGVRKRLLERHTVRRYLPPMNRDPAIRLEGEDGGGEAGELSREIEGQLARWRALIRRVAGRYGLDDTETDELVQDVRIRLWRALERGREKRAGVRSSYVYEAVMSAAIDLLQEAGLPVTIYAAALSPHTTSPCLASTTSRSAGFERTASPTCRASVKPGRM